MFRLFLNAFSGLFLGFILIVPSIAEETGSAKSDMPNDNAELEESVIPQEPFRIVGVGDSLMAGYKLDVDQSFTAQLETTLRNKGYDIVVLNAAVSGDTTTSGRERFDWSVPDDTNLVILELGANDMLRGISPALTRQNLDAMLARLKERKIPVILAGMMAAPNYGSDYAAAFNPIYPELAKKYDVPFYPLFQNGIIADPKYLLEDGMHPNHEGISVMVNNFLPLIEKELNLLGVMPQ